MAWLRWLVSDSDLYTSCRTVSGRPAKSLWTPMIFFQTSSAVAPFTMLVAEIAPGFTRGFISGAPVPTTVRTASTAMIELKRAPVASTPICFSTDPSPCSWMTCAIVKTFEIDWIDTSVFTSPAVYTLPSAVTTAIPNRFGSTLARAGM